MSGHTTGPWSLSDGWEPTLAVVDTQNVYGAPPSGVVAHVVMASQDGIYSDEKAANARLVAAAPDLYLFLRAAVNRGLFEKHDEREAAKALLDRINGAA